MELKIYKTLWGHQGTLDDAIADCREQEFDGIEGQAPSIKNARAEFRKIVSNAGLEFIAEICTAGSYVPDRQASPYKHLESLRCRAEAAAECSPKFLTIIAGCDAWSIGQSADFFGAALGIVDEFGIPVSFETHRSRSFFNPWTTRDILQQLPELKLTCDFSHWCVVCERLIIDTEPEIIALCAERAHHIHARVGYDQGPQVPHPAAPEFHNALEAHENWWTQVWRNQMARGVAVSTMTPEFGPDGYLQCQPFTGEPVADLLEINRWMAKRERERFEKMFARPSGKTSEAVNLTRAA
ncbi:MAG TPA: sugar phosphate isomerase/epimerase [Methylomirabilota bacterium]|nr:sugar phosphate isomerase/epimerase [Methylomirabilota bacterium]